MLNQITPYLNWHTYLIFQGVGLFLTFAVSLGTEYGDDPQNFITYIRAFFIPRKWTLLGVFMTVLFPGVSLITLAFAAYVCLGVGISYTFNNIINALNKPLFSKRVDDDE